MKILTLGLLMFFGINLINVILSTVKSVLTVKASKEVASMINAISYGFYAIVVKAMSDYSIEIVFTITILTNLVGVYFSKWALEKFKKDRLWKINVVVKEEQKDDLCSELTNNDLGYLENKIISKYGRSWEIKVFSYTQNESKKIKEILKKYNVKYHYNEVKDEL